MNKTITNIIQPESLYKILNVKNLEDAEKVLNTSLSFLLYLKIGDALVTATATFNKIDHDLIQIETCLDPDFIADELLRKRIIKFPF